MNFTEIANARQSCRSYDETREVEQEKLDAILNAARIAPSACNSQPYHITVCRGETATKVEEATQGIGGMNKFAVQAPVCLVITEEPYPGTAAAGAKVMGTDYRSIDMGILTAYITAEATAQGLESCILGWIDKKKVAAIIGNDRPARIVITLGYAKPDEKLRKKVRKELSELVTEL
ncbi:MAG: nitroreductase family protein [Oscillospiraceae bacterium]|nr:nitroreductase family protein [Oscillospiraceae bacterium]